MSIRATAPTATLFVGGVVPLLPVATSVTFGRSTIDLDSGSRVQQLNGHATDTSADGTASGVAQVRRESPSG